MGLVDLDLAKKNLILFEEHPLTTLLAGIWGIQTQSTLNDPKLAKQQVELGKFIADHSSEREEKLVTTHIAKGESISLLPSERSHLYSHLMLDFPSRTLSVDQVINKNFPRRVLLLVEESIMNGSSSILPVLRTMISCLQSFLKEKILTPASENVEMEESQRKSLFQSLAHLSVASLFSVSDHKSMEINKEANKNQSPKDTPREAVPKVDDVDDEDDLDLDRKSVDEKDIPSPLLEPTTPASPADRKEIQKNLFVLSWPNLYMNDDRATLLEEKLFNQLTQAKTEGALQANFLRVLSIPSPLSTPNSHSLSQLGLHFGDHVKRTWSFWGDFDGDSTCVTNHKQTTYEQALSEFDIQVSPDLALPEDVQAKIQQELLPTIKRQMKQVEEFLKSLSIKIEEKEIDKYLNVFNDHEVRTMEELKQLTNEAIEEIMQAGSMPDEIGEAMYAIRDKHIESMLTAQLNQKTIIEDALEYIREQIPSDFNRDELANVLKELKSKKVDSVVQLQAMDKRTYERALKRYNISGRATDLLLLLHRVELSAEGGDMKEDDEEYSDHDEKED
eukprot:TRINITY_DN9814_c0_g1_i1.p2 TRINITY_DN9814_c0_g1~~TRINITY_DN9814_c0_g1_i1.p2  ORF type:complete len:560 (-),score=173.93 TRINITY_DN9814_c0_g1_i1:54-1733(-)